MAAGAAHTAERAQRLRIKDSRAISKYLQKLFDLELFLH